MKRVTVGEGGPVAVPVPVLAGLEAVRRSGLTNMLDRPEVVRLARESGFEEAATWIDEHRTEYANGIFRGFVAGSEGDASK